MFRDLLENGSPMEIFATFVALALIVASVLCLVFIIFGGIRFILSAGNESTIKQAIHTIRYAIIGLIVTFLAFFAVKLITSILGIEFPLDFTIVLDLMREIFAALS